MRKQPKGKTVKPPKPPKPPKIKTIHLGDDLHVVKRGWDKFNKLKNINILSTKMDNSGVTIEYTVDFTFIKGKILFKNVGENGCNVKGVY
jgi:hypothetical protein